MSSQKKRIGKTVKRGTSQYQSSRSSRPTTAKPAMTKVQNAATGLREAGHGEGDKLRTEKAFAQPGRQENDAPIGGDRQEGAGVAAAGELAEDGAVVGVQSSGHEWLL